MQDSDYRIKKNEVLRYLGYKGQPVDSELNSRIDSLICRCLNVSDPKHCYGIYSIKKNSKGIELENTSILLTGKDIENHLNGAVSCAVMASTLGLSIERELIRLGQMSVSDELIFNAACTDLIELVSDRCEEEISAVAALHGYKTNFRFSPGYGDLPLELQPELLRLIGAESRIGITLTDSLLMMPRKSVSAIIGLFPKDTITTEKDTLCNTCANRDRCELRKAGTYCGR